MTNCEMAQVGIESLVKRLKEKCEEDVKERSDSLTLEIRKLMVCILWCSVHYGKYLDAFDPKGRALIEIEWITYTEEKEDLGLTEEEKTRDESVKKQELEYLSTLGTK